jgi:hypothetical protein
MSGTGSCPSCFAAAPPFLIVRLQGTYLEYKREGVEL